MIQKLQTSTGFFLLLVLTGAFLGQFDLFVVNVAAPSIQHNFNATPTQIELVVAGYAFMFASTLVTGGRLGDVFGHSAVYACGMLAFAVSTMLCAVSPNITTLIISRMIQGATAGVMIPQVLALLNTLLPEKERLPAMGWYGTATGIGSVLGQFLGGALVTWNALDLGWRWIFLITVPIGLIIPLVAMRQIPNMKSQKERHFDVLGAIGLALAMGFMISAILLYGSSGDVKNSILLVLCGSVIFGFTLGHERKLTESVSDPIIDISLFSSSAVWLGLGSVCIFMLYFSSFIFLLTNVLQHGLNLSPFKAGLAFVPSGVAFIVSSILFRKWAALNASKAILLGCLVTGLGLIVAAIGTLYSTSTLQLLMAAVIITGLGNGMILPVLIGFTLKQIPKEQSGVGGALVTTSQQFASAVGISSFGTMFYMISSTYGLVKSMGVCIIIQIAFMIVIILFTRKK